MQYCSRVAVVQEVDDSTDRSALVGSRQDSELRAKTTNRKSPRALLFYVPHSVARALWVVRLIRVYSFFFSTLEPGYMNDSRYKSSVQVLTLRFGSKVHILLRVWYAAIRMNSLPTGWRLIDTTYLLYVYADIRIETSDTRLSALWLQTHVVPTAFHHVLAYRPSLVLEHTIYSLYTDTFLSCYRRTKKKIEKKVSNHQVGKWWAEESKLEREEKRGMLIVVTVYTINGASTLSCVCRVNLIEYYPYRTYTYISV